jgi:hypothetical protein
MATEESRPTSARAAAAQHGHLPHHITDKTPYESALKPALWLLVPFILTLIYGYFY